jgi:hypothetical protein
VILEIVSISIKPCAAGVKLAVQQDDMPWKSSESCTVHLITTIDLVHTIQLAAEHGTKCLQKTADAVLDAYW